MQKRYPLCFQFDRSNRTSGHLLRSITAIATDNSGNAASNTTSSAPIQLTVTQGVAQVYYIHTDQLNTPRLITNSANAKVWEWNNDDPFANNPVNDDPNATGNHFTYNPRLPGQYFDSETNTNYNYYRDYDPATGRYIESDPIGLEGGINTYGYVGGNPLGRIDSKGLKFSFGDLFINLFPDSVEKTVGVPRGYVCSINLCKTHQQDALKIIEQCAMQAKETDMEFSGGILNQCIQTCTESVKKCNKSACVEPEVKFYE